ncbi:GlsB/YeaQ/YmgE family stress response membrane protein [Isoalcanivorax beigongshangi]|uniref:GlsB/YeaQ/YmgE family stress response membrane protein n=1 Tax=Isoalcanivorax beigongshangi TaxID=3238810 RepID=A0ABV4ALR6_9GAMM
MAILTWIILGLIAGVIAKWIMPGRDPGGFIITVIIGIAGAFVGGWLGNMLGIGTTTTGGLSIASIVTAVVGAIVLLALYRLIARA